MGTARRSRRNDRGVVAIEFIYIVPFFLMLCFLVVSLGAYIAARMKATDTARSQARAAAIAPMPNAACPDTNTIITKTVTRSYTWFVPLLPWSPGAATGTASARCGG